MKKILLWILAGLGAFVLFRMLTRKTSPAGILTQQQRNLGTNSYLDAYTEIMPPIAQLSRVPLTNGNLRMVDPVIPKFVYPNAIYQNGGP